jgi:membrane fusion protein, multidrug efflux system
MSLNYKKLIKGSVTIILVLVMIGIVVYPKIKHVFEANKEPNAGPSANSPRMRGGGQPLFASGNLIAPTNMSELIYATGSLLPDEEVELSFEASGKIVGIYFVEGARVKKGQLLAKLNDRPLQAQLLKLQAQRKLIEESLHRHRKLLEREAISRENFDQVSTDLESIDADILLLQARISETELRAPFNGIVGLRMISEGAYANPQTRIIRLVKIDPLKVEFSIPERYSGEVSPGYPISFVVDGIPEAFSAKVYAVDPKVNMDTRTIIVRALYPNAAERLKPGRFVNITLLLSQIENTIAIPSQAVIPEMGGEKVFIVKSGKAQEVRIRTGLRTESHVQIQNGLHFGDTLLITGILQLRNDMPVQLDTLIVNEAAIIN